MRLKSIWDGWRRENQFYGSLYSDLPPVNADCAGYQCAVIYPQSTPISDAEEAEMKKTFRRVATYIREKYPIPASLTRDVSVLIHANNQLRLTPAQFRRIDRETQIAEGMTKVRELVDAVESQPAPEAERVTA
jgi:hypothetical protein